MTTSISLSIAGLGLAYATFWIGAFDPYRFALAAAAIGIAGLITLFTAPPQDRPRPLPGWAILSLALIPAYLILQLLPLPAALLKILSPRAAETAGWLGNTAAPLSIAPNASLAFTFRILAALTVFFLIRQLAWQVRWMAVIPMVAIAVFEAALGLTQAATGVTVLGTYVNRNHFAFLLAISLPFVVMGGISLLKEISQAGRALLASLLFASGAVLLGAIIFSLSRGGFLAALASLFVLAVLNLQKRLRAGGFALLTLGFLALFFVLPITDLVLRFAEVSAEDAGLNSGARNLVWKDSMPVIRDFPVFGTGLGGYENAVQRHQTTALMSTIGYAHNEYIQFLAELGFFGVALFVVPLVWVVQILVRNVEDPIAKAGIASLVAMILHCIVDFNLQVPANLLTAAWSLGISSSFLPSHRMHKPW